jgi:diguanylate cyclase (GGDEF)-like protein
LLARITAAHWFSLLVSVGGCLALVAIVVDAPALTLPGSAIYALLLIPGVLLGELLPLKLPRRPHDEEITLSTTFVLALLVSAGLPIALLTQAAASVVQDVHARKPLHRAAFNVGQYTISLGAAAWVLHRLGAGDADPLPFSPADLPAMGAASLVFFGVNTVVVGTVVALHRAANLVASLRSDFDFNAATNAVMLCLAPVLLSAIHHTPLLYPLCLLPMLAVFHGGRQAARSEHEANHDALTGLPNRSRMRALVVRQIEEADAAGSRFAVLMLDINRFREINDTLGHSNGDELLRQVGERLRVAVGGRGRVARLGGDEFVVLLPTGTDGEGAETVARRIARQLRAPLEVEGLELEVDAGIGIARYPDDGGDAQTLLRRAEVAMYQAKQRHQPHVAYSAEHDDHSPVRLALAGELRRALESREIVPFYQPQVSLASGEFTGVEALARWQHPTLGLLSPASFVDIAERTGLVKALTLRMIEQALEDRRTWAADGVELDVAVNLSVRSLLDPRLPAQVARRLEDAGADAAQLKLELTESTIMADRETATAVLDELAAMGVRLAIDDFGTGYSSLAYLKQLPVDELKIDKSFVLGLGSDRDDATIVRSTVQLGHNLGLTVVAEGIETAGVLAQLAQLGCDKGQGYLLGRPMPAAQVVPTVSAMAAAQSLARTPGPRMRGVRAPR